VNNKMFDKSEIQNKPNTQRQQSAQVIKQRFDQKKSIYHQLRMHPSILFVWREVDQRISNFDEHYFRPWNQKWPEIQRTNQEQQLIDYFNEGEKFYEEMDKFVLTTNNLGIESLKAEVLNKIENDILHLKVDITQNIKTGIDSIIGLKAEIGLQKTLKKT